MQSSELIGRVKRAIDAGERFLLDRQGADGGWTDFDLPEVGAARAWTTAYAAWALACVPQRRHAALALRRAAQALHQERVAGGWSYNARADADADSTAWAWRFLLRVDDRRGLDPVSDLTGFLTPSGTARTFRGVDWQGQWAQPHADVTPVVGLALVAAQAPGASIALIRRAVLDTWCPPQGWGCYWWRSSSYAMAHSLALLATTGGVPAPLVEASAERLGQLPPEEEHALEDTLRLLAAASLGAPAPARRMACAVLSRQEPDGSWPASAALLLPDPNGRAPASCHADHQRSFTTASAVAALKQLLTTPSLHS
jgi:hypothetical protein